MVDACEKTGVKKIKLYNAVRHSLGCQLLDKGFEFDKVQKVPGHTRPEVTKRYAKRSNESVTQILIDRRAKIVDLVIQKPKRKTKMPNIRLLIGAAGV